MNKTNRAKVTAAARSLADLIPATLNNSDIDIRITADGLTLATGPECTDIVIATATPDRAIPGHYCCWALGGELGRLEFAGHLSPAEARALMTAAVAPYGAEAAA